MQCQVIDNTGLNSMLLLAIIEADLLIANLAAAHLQGCSIRRIQDLALTGNRFDAILDHTDVFKQPRHFPHNPLRHALQA